MERTGFVDWMFRSRTTGRITLLQVPNWRLLTWLLASAVMSLGHLEGRLHDVVAIVASLALALWAVGEVHSGVNPFRRILGAVVVIWLVVSLVNRG